MDEYTISHISQGHLRTILPLKQSWLGNQLLMLLCCEKMVNKGTNPVLLERQEKNVDSEAPRNLTL